MADPPVAAPAVLRPLLGFRRLTGASFEKIAQVMDEHPDFRARVAEAADEDEVGRAGWLWLNRPDGWEDDPSLSGASDEVSERTITQLTRERDTAQAAADRFRGLAEDQERRRRGVEAQLRDVRRRASSAEEKLAALEVRLEEVDAARTRAVRLAKDHERDLTETRHDLKVAREAAREAEAELLTRPAGTGGSEAPSPPAVDVDALRRALAEADRALDDAERALAGQRERPVPGPKVTPGPTNRARRRPALPPGLIEESAEADRHLVSSAEVLTVVDGYNLARHTWSDLEPEEERRRTVALVEEAAARSGSEAVVVFDGDHDVVSPVASRAVRVRYSPRGVTADDTIAELLATVPRDRPVVVVSSDRAVQEDARRNGAVPIRSEAFVAAVRR